MTDQATGDAARDAALQKLKDRAVAEEIASPLERAVAAKNLAKRNPYPDAGVRIEQEARRIDVPIDHHPEAIRGRDHSLEHARAAMGALRECWEHVSTAAADLNVDRVQLSKLASGAVQRTLARVDAASAQLQQRLDTLDAEIEQEVAPKQADALAVEIRNHWRTQKPAVIGLMDRVRRKDRRTTSAVLNAPAYLSGLTDDEQENLRAAAVTEFCFGETGLKARRLEVAAAHRLLKRAGERMIETITPRLRAWSARSNDSLNKLREVAGQ